MLLTRESILYDIEEQKKMAIWGKACATADLEKAAHIDWLSIEYPCGLKPAEAREDMLERAESDRASADDDLLRAHCLEKLMNGR